MKRVLENDGPAQVPRAEPLDCLLPELWLAEILPNLPIEFYLRTCVMLRRTCRWLYANVPTIACAQWPYGDTCMFWKLFNQEVVALIEENILAPLSWPLSARFREYDERDIGSCRYTSALKIPLRLGRSDVFTLMLEAYRPNCLTKNRNLCLLARSIARSPDEDSIPASLACLHELAPSDNMRLLMADTLLFRCAEKERYTAFQHLAHLYFNDLVNSLCYNGVAREHFYFVFDLYTSCLKNEENERWWSVYFPLLLNEPRFPTYWCDGEPAVAGKMREILAEREARLKIKQSL